MSFARRSNLLGSAVEASSVGQQLIQMHAEAIAKVNSNTDEHDKDAIRSAWYTNARAAAVTSAASARIHAANLKELIVLVEEGNAENSQLFPLLRDSQQLQALTPSIPSVLAFLKKELADTEKYSSQVLLRAYDPAKVKAGDKQRMCHVRYNSDGEWDARITLPFLRCAVSMQAESNFDFESESTQPLLPVHDSVGAQMLSYITNTVVYFRCGCQSWGLHLTSITGLQVCLIATWLH